jgi:uncharacterized protein (TIGR02996 family)
VTIPTVEEQAHRGILADPFDDLVKLAYCDALEEMGDIEQATIYRSLYENNEIPWLFDCLRMPPEDDQFRLYKEIIHKHRGLRAYGVRSYKTRRGYAFYISIKFRDWLRFDTYICEKYPIILVDILNLYPVTSSLGGSSVRRWTRGLDNVKDFFIRTSSSYQPGRLPYDIWEMLPKVSDRYGEYPTDRDAYKALSCACVRFARKKAKLPDISPKKLYEHSFS